MAQHFANIIAGESIPSAQVTLNINPSNLDDVIGEYAQGTAADVAQAVAAAKQAFPSWSHTTPYERYEILKRAADELQARREELGRLLAREEGKTLNDAMGEISRASQIIAFYAGEALRLTGETVPSLRPGIGIEMTREPIGVVGLITPWNFPIAIPAWKLGPALAYGCTAVLKPADLVPASAWHLVDILHRAGLPRGVVNLVMGKGSVVGQALVEHPDIAGISFTGSVDVGRGIAQGCTASTPMKKVQLEMGGKNPLVVLDDADLDIAVECAISGSFYLTGQRCTASSRLIVTNGIHDAFVARLIERIKELKVGDALDPAMHLGPAVSEMQLNQDLNYIDIGQAEGAVLQVGGERLTRDTPGYYIAPSLFTEANNQMRIAREEIFGPVTSVIRASSYEDALAIANDTPFGLASSICTQSLKYATDFKRHSEAGMVMVNLPTGGADYHVAFGGRKASSYGPREQGHYAREFYTIVKTSYTRA